MLSQVKLALRLTTDAYDSELNSLIDAAFLDLGIAGVAAPEDDPLYARAVITYVRMMFGSPDNYEQLRQSYEIQKGQMWSSTGYTNWESGDCTC